MMPSAASSTLSLPKQPPSSVFKQTHYDVLQILSTATPGEIKKAYRSLVVRYHPDKLLPIILKNDEDSKNNRQDVVHIFEGLFSIDNDEDDTDNESVSHGLGKGEAPKTVAVIDEKAQTSVPNTKDDGVSALSTVTFHQIQAAYQCLRDPNKRRQYDESISREEERDEWKLKGAVEVNLSEMECDLCCVVDDEDNYGENEDHGATDEPQKVFFYPCRCGDKFQIFQEDLLESINDRNNGFIDREDVLTDRAWQCESCCLSIRINVDIDEE